jgi:hypothetical protein
VKTFAEQVHGLTTRHARRTPPLLTALARIALALACPAVPATRHASTSLNETSCGPDSDSYDPAPAEAELQRLASDADARRSEDRVLVIRTRHPYDAIQALLAQHKTDTVMMQELGLSPGQRIAWPDGSTDVTVQLLPGVVPRSWPDEGLRGLDVDQSWTAAVVNVTASRVRTAWPTRLSVTPVDLSSP